MPCSIAACPAANNGDGTAQFTAAASGCGTGCTSVRGVVPWQTLGLSRPDGSDAFGTRFRYEVTAALVVAGSMERSGTTYTPLGTVVVQTAAAAAVTSAAAYVLVSYGPNRQGGFGEVTGTQIAADGVSTVEPENTDADNTYVQDQYTSAAGTGYFDDIVRWRSKPVIVQSCGAGACGNPS